MSTLLPMPTLLNHLEQGVRELFDTLDQPLLVGIRTGGVWLAQYLRDRLAPGAPVGELDISFYRDDFSRIGLNPTVRPSSLPFETEGRNLILVDDVVMSGRTVRAAMNELFDYGRPARIRLAALVDLGARDLPIHPDVIAQELSLPNDQRVKLRGPEPLEAAVIQLEMSDREEEN